ncbi:MAG: Fis family transcriptional regulator [Epsilonproteobacteria bacterium]|nr:MAG: Fis family transcriptional regulator [Campylobacterota bacterium]
MSWKNKVEHKFEHISDFIFDNRIKVIFVVFAIVIAMASQMKYLTVDTSTEGFLHKNDPLRIEYNDFRDQFGRDEKVLIAIQSDNIFTIKFLTKLNKLHKELENNLPYIEDVNSLINARNTRGTADALIVDDLFEELPTNEKALAFKTQLAKNNPLFKDLIIDEAGTITTIVIDTQTYTSLDKNGKPILVKEDEDEFADEEDTTSNEPKEFLSDWENVQIVNATKAIVDKYRAEDFDILVSGTAVINAELKASMTSDMQTFIKYVLLVMSIFLALMFRRISGVILPLVTVLFTIISALSFMAMFGAPITVVTQILPSFLLAVTVGASIHLLSIFFKQFNISKDKKASLRYAMGHSGLAILMTSLTTAAGLWSFSFSELAPVADLGKFASAGVIVGLLYTLILLPAFLSLIKLKPKDIKMAGECEVETPMDKLLIKVADISVTYPKQIIAITTVIILLSLAIASQLRFSHKPIVWFDENHPVRLATDIVDDKLKGSVTLEIIVDTQKENGLYEPEILNAIDNFSKNIMTIKSDKYFVGKTLSIVDIIKETNKALNENKKEAYIIPQDKNLIAQELLLFENSGSDDLEDFVDSGFQKARITVKLPYIDAMDYVNLLKEINVQIEENFANKATVTVTGISNLLARIMEAAISSSAISYVLALTLITIMMLILIGNIKIGLISMIPNISPILMMTTVMVIFDMPLDMFTMLIGAIAIGLAVDDTVHFMHNFRRYELVYNDVDKAVRMTLLTTGRAMVVTTIVLSFGFFVFMFASMSNIFNFGLLTGIAIIIAVLADFFLVPAIMKVMVSNRRDVK